MRSEGEDPGQRIEEEVTMRKGLLTICASILLVAGGAVVASAGQTSASTHQKRIVRHQNVAHSANEITSFSSSSVLHIGVNHPPKNR
jgi:hypothetical protein